MTSAAFPASSRISSLSPMTIGDAATIVSRIAEYVAVGVEKFILRPVGPDGETVIAQTRRLIDEVLPQVSARWPKRGTS